jgi:peptidoglycan/LPS O-acetylase OafA/YrhL
MLLPHLFSMRELVLQYPPLGRGRSQLIDELRGFAILLVLMYHTCGVTGVPAVLHGELGVDVFVLLSGLSLALTHRSEEGFGLFLWRRFARLLPAYWIALTLFWGGGVFLLGRVHSSLDLIAHYLCIHQFWGDRFIISINDSFWFLALISSLYVVYAAMRPWLARGRIDLVLGVGGLLSFLAAFICHRANQPALFLHYGLRPGMFFVGLAVGVMLRQGEVRIALTPWLGLGFAVAVYGAFVANVFVVYNFAGFALFIAYWATRSNADAAAARPLCRGLAWVGVYSYEIFLLHQPLIREYNHYIWTRWIGVQPQPWQLGLGVLVMLAVTFWAAFELQRVAGSITRRLSPPAPGAPA